MDQDYVDGGLRPQTPETDTAAAPEGRPGGGSVTVFIKEELQDQFTHLKQRRGEQSNRNINEKASNGANLGFEATLWVAADKLRNNMDAAEYKHVVLGLIFLKYISDAFEERHRHLEYDLGDPFSQWYIKEPQARYLALEDPDEYRSENIFRVPKEARWSYLQGMAKQPTIGKLIDDAMVAIERDNPMLKGVLPKDYNRPALDKQRLGELIDLIGTIGLGDKENRSKDIIGRVYEYFLSQFASAEGKKGGQFYTARCVVRLLAEMIEPYKGRVYDPCCCFWAWYCACLPGAPRQRSRRIRRYR
jgi:type I restriction enzyme M protein